MYPVTECELLGIFSFGVLSGLCFAVGAAVGSGVCFVLALVAAYLAVSTILGIKRDTGFDDEEW
jgi:hypothetical protein